MRSAAVVAVLLLCAASHSYAQVAYISDELTVPLRSGPSNAHRILHRGLPSGTRLEVLAVDPDSGFTHVRTENGTDGWVPTQYLADAPIARDRLRNAQAQIQRLTQQLAEAREALADARSAGARSRSDADSLGSEKERLENELAELKRISASALEAHQAKQQLETLNARLRSELDDLIGDNRRLQSNLQERWLLIGGALVLAGLIAGVFIKSRPRRSGWS